MDYTRDEYFLHFTGNKAEKLSCQFPVPIPLTTSDGGKKAKWEIAPMEISLTADWNTFDPKEDYFRFHMEGVGDYTEVLPVPAKHLNDNAKFAKAMTDQKSKSDNIKRLVTFAHTPNTGMITLKISEPALSVSLSPELANKFSVPIPPGATESPRYRVPLNEDSVTLSWTVDYYQNRRLIYILCDQAPYQMIANAAYPILSAFPIGGSYVYKEWCQHIYYQNHYQTLDCGKILNGMNIWLADKKMKPLKAVFDHAYCLVHLRRKKPYK